MVPTSPLLIPGHRPDTAFPATYFFDDFSQGSPWSVVQDAARVTCEDAQWSSAGAALALDGVVTRAMAPIHNSPRLVFGALLRSSGAAAISVTRNGYRATIRLEDRTWVADSTDEPLPLAMSVGDAWQSVIVGVDTSEGTYTKDCYVNGQRVAPQLTITNVTELPEDVEEVNVWRGSTPVGWAGQALHEMAPAEREAEAQAHGGVVTLTRSHAPIVETTRVPAPLVRVDEESPTGAGDATTRPLVREALPRQDIW
jgi:hypothetical protein